MLAHLSRLEAQLHFRSAAASPGAGDAAGPGRRRRRVKTLLLINPNTSLEVSGLLQRHAAPVVQSAGLKLAVVTAASGRVTSPAKPAPRWLATPRSMPTPPMCRPTAGRRPCCWPASVTRVCLRCAPWPASRCRAWPKPPWTPRPAAGPLSSSPGGRPGCRCCTGWPRCCRCVHRCWACSRATQRWRTRRRPAGCRGAAVRRRPGSPGPLAGCAVGAAGRRGPRRHGRTAGRAAALPCAGQPGRSPGRHRAVALAAPAADVARRAEPGPWHGLSPELAHWLDST